MISEKTTNFNTHPILGHRNDTVLLQSNVDFQEYPAFTIFQCLFQNEVLQAIIYVIDHKNTTLRTVGSMFKSPIYNPGKPSYNLGIQDYLYLLPGSSFTYEVCLASSTNITKSVTYFLFQGENNYTQYIVSRDNGTKYSLYATVHTSTGSLNCTIIAYNITEAAYYFMMMRSPADVSVSYNFTQQQVVYDITNSQSYCSIISKSSECEVTLSNTYSQHLRYDILANVKPDPFDEPLITHFCLRNIQENTLPLKHWEIVLIVLGGVIGLVLTPLFIVCVTVHYFVKDKGIA